MDTTQIVLAVFFLYFVLLSGYCSTVLNCQLQRFLETTVWFKHILIFLSIFVFTFVLNWYTFDSLVTDNRVENMVPLIRPVADGEPEETERKKRGRERQRVVVSLNMILNWFVLTTIIYGIFIVSTKTEWVYLASFLVLIFFVVALKVFIKTISDATYTQHLSKLLFITEREYGMSHDNSTLVVRCHNASGAMYILMLVLLGVGCYKYGVRQYAEHRANWSWQKFVFGFARNCKLEREHE